MSHLRLDRKVVELESHQEISYDILSINIGSITKSTASIPGVQEHTLKTRPISGEL